MSDSRIAGLYRLPVAARIARLEDYGWLSPADAASLCGGHHVLSPSAADRMIENVIGVFGLPFAVAPNFIVNGRETVVPLVIEEPSVVAGLAAAAGNTRAHAGFDVQSDTSLLIGQVHVTAMPDADHAVSAVNNAAESLLELASSVHPRLLERGGGVRDIETRLFELPDGQPLLALHVLVDTCDAMGANLVNQICEVLAPEVESLTGGKAALRILSNLADRSLYTARATFSVPDDVRDAIVTANDIARVDPYRATTHNKGIMNGVDALAIATGNDWRAIEAAAHAYAAADGRYRSLTRWFVDDGKLVGELTLPLKVGTVGGTLSNNAAAELGLALTGAQSAHELAELMVAVGLAQNFAALRALVTSGIQAGHMKLHARSVAAAAGAPPAHFDTLVDRLVASGEIKDWKARELLEEMTADTPARDGASAAGKIILLGEHGVVYGRRALALPIPDAVSVQVTRAEELTHELPASFIDRVLDELGIHERDWRIEVDSKLPIGKGLGSSAAIAVAMVRAFDRELDLGLDDERVNAIAFASEQLIHGTPSGVDNTLSTYARPMLFRNDETLQFDAFDIETPPPLVIAWGDETGQTGEQVADVRRRYDRAPEHFNALFDEMDALAGEGAKLLRAGNYEELGNLMNLCHGLLNAIGVSTPELERMVALARAAGAAGAKLTGAGGGGAIVALCPGRVDEVRLALCRAGYQVLGEGHD